MADARHKLGSSFVFGVGQLGGGIYTKRLKDWVDGEILYELDLDAEFDNIAENLTIGSLTKIGLLQLEDSHESTSTRKAACPKNVKEAYDLAAANKYPDTGEQAFLDADHTKLDGIETGATKYPDTGEQAFLDADHTKLNGIGIGADVTGDNAPQAHLASHQNAGSDEINVGGLSGLLADDQHVLDSEVLAIAAALAHNIASHPDTTATGAQLNTLVGGGETSLHSHAGDAVYISGTPELNDIAKFTNANTLVGRSRANTRIDLGLVIGTNVQAYDADLTILGGLGRADGNFIVGTGTTWTTESGSTARASLGLGSAATRNAEDTMTNGSNLPDGAAIKTYGDANWGGGGSSKWTDAGTYYYPNNSSIARILDDIANMSWSTPYSHAAQSQNQISMNYSVAPASNLRTALSIQAEGKGLGTTAFRGVMGLYAVAKDRSDVVSGNKGVLYGILAEVSPQVTRGSTSPGDDAVCLGLSNAGSAKATEAIYIGNNASLGDDFVSSICVDSDSYYGLRFAGDYTYGIDFVDGGPATFATSAIRMGAAPIHIQCSSGDLKLSDPTAGTKTLTQLAASGGWPSTITYVAPGNNTLSSAVTAASSGDILMLGSGTYSQSVPVAINAKSLTIRGAGKGQTIVAFSGCHGIQITTGDKVTLENFTIETNGTTYYGLTITGHDTVPIKVSGDNIFRFLEFRGNPRGTKYWARNIDLNLCWASTFDNIVIYGGDWMASQYNGFGMYSDFSVDIKVSNCTMYGLAYCIYLSSVISNNGNGHRSEGWTITDNTLMVSEVQVEAQGCIWLDISHNCLDHVQKTGIYCNEHVLWGSISDNWIALDDKPNTQVGIFLNGACNFSIGNNTISASGTQASRNGIVIIGSKNSIMGNFIGDQSTGLWLKNTSTYNTVVGNICDSCTTGILNQGANNDLGHNINKP